MLSGRHIKTPSSASVGTSPCARCQIAEKIHRLELNERFAVALAGKGPAFADL
jgi:hypothetical protein